MASKRSSSVSMSRRSRNSGAITMRPSDMVVGVVLIALIFYLLYRKGLKPVNRDVGKYNNLEAWNVTYNADGLPTKIEIHREATRT